nr:hypothetical protein [Proteus mirabilis]
MAIAFIPSLIALLEAKEKEAGCELTPCEVESIRDNATQNASQISVDQLILLGPSFIILFFIVLLHLIELVVT